MHACFFSFFPWNHDLPEQPKLFSFLFSTHTETGSFAVTEPLIHPPQWSSLLLHCARLTWCKLPGQENIPCSYLKVRSIMLERNPIQSYYNIVILCLTIYVNIHYKLQSRIQLLWMGRIKNIKKIKLMATPR